ncbi:glycosyl transferase, group 1 family protein [Synechococcus sp. PCC 7335]|uniref:glycosyltransferase family 4 protein n=1 Tax=Synechococcus sp. (strain ATCC 29403 / PCC 7335) TaxID=91464 RepID=UPI00017ED99E|nr:glycosyltransferase family 1 protein [Synechococcus sp. PCC 7335]EDX86828.1 glycosyl transferase, group 1 family protein [Synechococcus sp. PCC 7335]
MRVAILRSTAQSSISMKVYANNIVDGLKEVRPDWEILDISPKIPIPGEVSALQNSLSKYYDRYWHYPRSLKSCEADVFHIVDHSDGHLASALKRYGKRSVVTCHDLINWVQPEMYQGLAIMPLISLNSWRWSVKQMADANHVVTVSEHTAADVTESLQLDSEVVTAIPNAVSDQFSPASAEAVSTFRESKGVNSSTFCLLNVGSNNPRKNVSAILETMHVLKQRSHPVHFWKAGSNFTSEQCEFIATHQLTDHVTYLGKLDSTLLPTLYSAADVLVAPSLYEGFGLTVLEAMACGTPVVTANTTSLPEVAGDAAILVAPSDTEAIASATERLIEDLDLRQQLSAAGLSRAALFTWTNTASQLASIYEHVYNASR